MKLWRLVATVGLVLGLGFPALAAERILNFNSRIVVQTNGALLVTETIRVHAGGYKIRHGIYRDFPQLYRGAYGLRMRTGFTVRDVRLNGEPVPYHTGNRENGVRVYIGDPNATLSADNYTYRLTYETDRQLGFFDKYDELYWNVTGNGWEFPIERASATVLLPGDTEPGVPNVEGAVAGGMKAYTGTQGQQGHFYLANLVHGNAHFETTKPLPSGEGLTIVVQWPKGVVTQPAADSLWWRLLNDNRGVVMGFAGLLIVLLYFAVVWTAVGKDPKGGTIIPLYGPPDGLSPAAVRFVENMAFDNRAFSAAILNLAVKGAIAIRRDAENCYTLVRKDGEKAELLPEEKQLFEDLMGGGTKAFSVEPANHKTIKAAQNNLRKSLSTSFEKTYFVKNFRYWLPGLVCSVVPLGVSLLDSRQIGPVLFLSVWLTLWSFGVAAMLSQIVTLFRGGQWWAAIPIGLFSLPFIGAEIAALCFLVYEASYWVAGIFVAGIVLNGLFYHLLKAPTVRGRKVMDQIDGFKMYLSVAEKDRLNLENPPERTPQLFEKFLPYALALGVEQKWAEKFSDVLSKAETEQKGYSPAWFVGTGAFTSSFSSAMCSSLSGAIASSSSAPGSSSGGGGGSSGGGGGGGGGGGW